MLFTPLIHLTNGTANWTLRRLGIEPAEELRFGPVTAGARFTGAQLGSTGVDGPRHRDTGGRSLQFGSRTAEELMTPRTEIVTLEVDDTVADLVAAAIQTGYSRFPIVEGDLDETIAIVHVKQVFEVPPKQHRTTGWPAWRGRSPRCRRPWTATT